MSYIFIQTIGFIGLGSFLISYQTKSNTTLIVVQTIGNVLFGIQYFLLGGISGSLVTIVIAARNILAVAGRDKIWIRWNGWIILFSTIGVLITVYTWNGFISLLPLVAIIGGTKGYLSNNAQKIRKVNLFCCTPCWMLYDILTGSIGGIINEALGFFSILISVYRYGWKAMGENRFDGRQEGK